MMKFTPPKLQLKGDVSEKPRSLGGVLRSPGKYWSESVLRTGVQLLQIGRKQIAIVADPDLVQSIVLNRGKELKLSKLFHAIFEAGYSDVDIPESGPRRQGVKTLLAKQVSAGRSRNLLKSVEFSTNEIFEEWRELGADKPLQLSVDARRLALDILYRSTLAGSGSCYRKNEALDRAARQIVETGSMDLKSELAQLRVPAEEIVISRTAKGHEDFLPPSLQSVGGISFFIHTGHDNVSATMVWMLWLIAHYPEYQARVRTEQENNGNLSDLTLRNSFALTVVLETLRLYPPIMQLARDVTKPFDLKGVSLPEGSSIVMSIYAMQRLESYWRNPDKFVPDRFIGESGSIRKLLRAWMPFGKGSHGCIGNDFALIELSAILSLVCKNFEIKPNPDCPLTLRSEWNLRAVGKAPIFLRPLA